jgi:CO/xanthine dehydrogenase Mo-binding subunit
LKHGGAPRQRGARPRRWPTFGSKGSGEAGYLGAPAGVANAVNDAPAPLGAEVNTLPLSHLAI